MNVTGSVWSSRVDSISVGSSSSPSSSSAAATERAASKNSVQRTLIVNANGSMGIGMAVIEVLAVAEVLPDQTKYKVHGEILYERCRNLLFAMISSSANM